MQLTVWTESLREDLVECGTCGRCISGMPSPTLRVSLGNNRNVFRGASLSSPSPPALASLSSLSLSLSRSLAVSSLVLRSHDLGR